MGHGPARHAGDALDLWRKGGDEGQVAPSGLPILAVRIRGVQAPIRSGKAPLNVGAQLHLQVQEHQRTVEERVRIHGNELPKPTLRSEQSTNHRHGVTALRADLQVIYSPLAGQHREARRERARDSRRMTRGYTIRRLRRSDRLRDAAQSLQRGDLHRDRFKFSNSELVFED